mgnify:CR=1 FL=1
MKYDFTKKGFAKNEAFISIEEVQKMTIIYNSLLSDKKRTSGLRSDLSGKNNPEAIEKITQIMRPSLVEPCLLKSFTYSLAINWVKDVLGDDMELDFDMLINKAPNTNTETPWHQDAAYWIEMPDKRAASCWIALDDVFEENGCMWFIPKEKNQEIIVHQSLPNKGALFCITDTSNAVAVPLKPGGCTFHDGFTFHYSKGNATQSQRRALILNFRPKKMIELERKMGIDHTGERKIRNK